MSVIKFLRDWTDLFNWSTDDNPTTQQDYQEAVKNWIETERNLVDTLLWQPDTEYAIGDMVKTPSIPSRYCLICTAAGTSGANEPTYSDISLGDSVTDNTVTWTVATNEAVVASGTDYIRYESGVQICWGRYSISSSSSPMEQNITYSVPFLYAVYPSVGNDNRRSTSLKVYHENVSSTGFTVTSIGLTSGSASGGWVAVGYWK